MLSDQNKFYTKSLIYSSSTTYVMGHIARLWWAEARAFPQNVLRSKFESENIKVYPLVTAVKCR